MQGSREELLFVPIEWELSAAPIPQADCLGSVQVLP